MFKLQSIRIFSLLFTNCLNLGESLSFLHLLHLFFKDFDISLSRNLFKCHLTSLFLSLGIHHIFVFLLGSLHIFLDFLFFSFFECALFVLGPHFFIDYKGCVSTLWSQQRIVKTRACIVNTLSETGIRAVSILTKSGATIEKFTY